MNARRLCSDERFLFAANAFIPPIFCSNNKKGTPLRIPRLGALSFSRQGYRKQVKALSIVTLTTKLSGDATNRFSKRSRNASSDEGCDFAASRIEQLLTTHVLLRMNLPR